MAWFNFFRKKSAPVSVRRNHAQNALGRSFAAGKVDDITASFTGSSLPINEELRRDLRRIRARSRQLSFDNDYLKKFLHMVKANVVGVNGIVLQARSMNGGVLDKFDNKIIETAWRDWGRPRHCSVSGRHSWLDIQNLAVASVARDGEVLIQLIDKPSHPFGFVLRVYSADYLDETFNKKLPGGGLIVMGVEYDSDGAVVAYHLRDEDRRAYQNTYQAQKYRRLDARNIIHLFVSDHPDQARGIPWAHTAIRRLNQLGSYEEAELVAARIGASKMGFYTSPDGVGPTPDSLAPESSELNETDLVEEVAPGTFHNLPEGVGFTAFDPQHPTTAFDPFTKACLRGISSGLNVAYHGLSNDLEGVNFSSIRAGVLEERDQWRVLQKMIIEHLCSRVYERWLPSAILQDKAPIPFKKIDTKYMAVHWQPRGWPWVDPAKDAKANNEKVALGTETRTNVLAAEGKDFQETIDLLAYEQSVADAAGVNINPALPEGMPNNVNSN